MRAVLLVFVLAGAACATTGDGGRYDPYLITRAEIETSPYQTASEIVRGLRSRWLAPVAGTSIMAGQGVVRIYMDGAPAQGLETIPKMLIEEIRFYRPAEAQARWGLSHHRGAIDVITRKDGRGGG